MGLVTTLTGLSGLFRSAGGLTRTLRGDRAEEAEAQHIEHLAALSQLGAEFAGARASWFDSLIDGINRLPRPALAIGTLGLFVYSMADPVGFAARMQGLDLVPDQLWWLLGAIVSFYFGARELHYFRKRGAPISLDDLRRVTTTRAAIEDIGAQENGEAAPAQEVLIARQGDPSQPDHNAAVADWRRTIAARP